MLLFMNLLLLKCLKTLRLPLRLLWCLMLGLILTLISSLTLSSTFQVFQKRMRHYSMPLSKASYKPLTQTLLTM